MSPDPVKEDPVSEMKVRRTTLADGRYLIYYSFEPEVPEDSEIVPLDKKERSTSRDAERE